MKKIFVPNRELLVPGEISLDNEDFFHLTRALRTRPGESFIIGTPEGREYRGSIKEIFKNHLTITLLEEYKRSLAPAFSITLFFSLLKGDKNDNLIRQGSEIGIDRFVPVITRNSVVRPDLKKEDHRTARWNKIAREAAMQCNKQRVSEINSIINLEEIIKYDKKEANKIIAYYDSSTTIHSYLAQPDRQGSEFWLFIGPEGDFEQGEIDFLRTHHWECVTCHPHILRSETAALYIGSVLYHTLWNRS